jgi:hypothetical protein
MSTAEQQPSTAEVSENKFNATATFTVVAENEKQAKTAARRYFRERHGEDPTKVIAETDTGYVPADGKFRFTIMAANHSSGSLQDSETYEF